MMTATTPLKFIADEHQPSCRLDQFLAQVAKEFSRSQHQIWIKQGLVEINNTAIKSCRHPVKPYDSIVLQPEIEDKSQWQAHPLELDIIYEDPELLILNKQAGVVMHPGAGSPIVTLANGLLHYLPSIKQVPRAGIVHRLDKDTSGICVVAKTPQAHLFLTQQMKKRNIQRFYQTFVHGQVFCSGSLETFMDRHPHKRTQMAVTASGKKAITHYKIIQKFQHNTLLEVKLDTGRTHQIRVHMAHLNHPVCADPTYNKPINHYTHLPNEVMAALTQLNRQALHACQLSLPHPQSKELMTWKAPMPDDMRLLGKQLEQYQSIEELC